MLSNYHGSNNVVNSHTPLLAMTRALPSAHVAYAQGCDISSNDTSGITAAVDAAKAADAAVVFLGLDQSQEREGLDRNIIHLPGVQLQLL